MLANRFVKSLEATWDEVVVGPGSASNHSQRSEKEDAWRNIAPSAKAKFCLDSGLPWNAWELEFLENMLFRHSATEKQLNVLDRLHAGARARSQR